ncbi:MAG: HU family DNA-binding protein [Planctomycetota bacterium]|nr:MAG: HU family DNA-binding protein [Planctomycetota bacterium]
MTTKRDIAKSVAEKTALTQAQAGEVIQLTLEAFADVVLNEGRLELRNFGVFEVKRRAPRKARDPRTGETLDLPARNTIVFRPGRALERRLARLPLSERKAR